MPVALKIAVEFVRYSRGEIRPADLLRREEFARFQTGELETGFRSALRGLLNLLSAEGRRVLEWLAFLPEPLPREALEALAGDGGLAEMMARLSNSVLIAAETDVSGARWYRLHGTVAELIRESQAASWRDVGERGAGRLLSVGNQGCRERRYPVAEACLHAAEIIWRALLEEGYRHVRDDLIAALQWKAQTLWTMARHADAAQALAEAARWAKQA